jgi:small subunit ribosomal protein S8
MSMSDPIADLLTRIRNGLKARHEEVVLPASKLKAGYRKGTQK